MPDCPEGVELLAVLCGAEVQDRAGVLAHAAGCPRCAQLSAEVRRMRDGLGQLFSDNTPRAAGDCPDDEDLLAYADGSLDGAEAKQIKGHLDECETCLLWVAETRMAMAVAKPPAVGTPRRLLLRGRRISVAARRRQHPTTGPAQTARGLARQVGVQRRHTAVVRLAYGFAGSAVAGALLLFVLHHHGGYRGPVADRGIGSKPPRIAIVPGPESEPVLRGAPPAPVPGLDTLVFWYRLQGSGQTVQVPMPSDSRISLTSRDEYGLQFRPREGGWVYVFQVDSRGQLAQLFPLDLSSTPGNPVIPGRDYRLPGERKAYQLDEVVGEETVYVVFTRERRTVWEKALGVPPAAGGKDQQARVIADLRELGAVGEAYAIRLEHEPAAPR